MTGGSKGVSIEGLNADHHKRGIESILQLIHKSTINEQAMKINNLGLDCTVREASVELCKKKEEIVTKYVGKL